MYHILQYYCNIICLIAHTIIAVIWSALLVCNAFCLFNQRTWTFIIKTFDKREALVIRKWMITDRKPMNVTFWANWKQVNAYTWLTPFWRTFNMCIACMPIGEKWCVACHATINLLIRGDKCSGNCGIDFGSVGDWWRNSTFSAIIRITHTTITNIIVRNDNVHNRWIHNDNETVKNNVFCSYWHFDVTDLCKFCWLLDNVL